MGFYSWVNDQWVEGTAGSVSVYDTSVTRGLSLFEYLRTYQGVPFELEAHLDRLFNGINELQWMPRRPQPEVTSLVEEAVRKNWAETGTDMGVRMIVSGGLNTEIDTGPDPLLAILCSELHLPSPEQYDAGITLMSWDVLRQAAHLKHGNYLSTHIALRKARSENFDDIVFCDGQRYLECSRGNIIAVDADGNLVAPKDGLLPGIARATAIEVAREQGLTVIERDLHCAEMENITELFQTGSSKEILPIRAIDTVWQRPVGPVTRQLMAAYRAKVEETIHGKRH